ncbi:ComEC/Rec2 family competence protein [Candidatus Omnitrophota bacterium]
MRRPLVSITIWLCFGILFARLSHISFEVLFYIAVFAFCAGFVFLKRYRKSLIFLLWLCFFLIGALLLKNSEQLPPRHISQYLSSKSKIASLEGIVDSDPIIKTMSWGKKTSFTLNVEKLIIKDAEYYPRGKVLINIYREEKIRYADRVVLIGKIYKPMRFQISDTLNYREYLQQKNIYGIFSVKKDGSVVIVEHALGNPFKSIAFVIKGKVKAVIEEHLPFLEAAFMKAMLLGERQDIPRALKDIFVYTGTVHILAISGLHIGIVAFIILLFLRAIRVPRKIRFVITIAFLIMYIFITGGRPSVIRATVMAVLLLGGFLFEREIDLFNSLAAAALVILICNPQQLFDIGFQLSFVSVVSILLFYPQFEKLLKRKTDKTIAFLFRSLCVSTAAWLGVAGLIAYHFKIVTPVALCANLFVVPFITIIIAIGFSFVVSGLLVPQITFLFALPLRLSLFILVKITYLFGTLPFSYFFTGTIRIYWIVSYYCILAAAFFLLKHISDRR